jgi:hypothetical protein
MEGPADDNIQDYDEIEITPYDNNTTLLYKYLRMIDMPINLVIARPRTNEDDVNMVGTQDGKYVFESIIDMVGTLINKGESAKEIFETIKQYKPSIDIHDIAMSYYSLSIFQGITTGLSEQINDVYYEIDNTRTNEVENDEDLARFYTETWLSKYNKLKKLNFEKLNIIEDIQNELSKIDQEEKIPVSPISINSSIVLFSPTIGKKAVDENDGPEIFNNAIVSEFVPFIRYNDKNSRSLSRVYTGGRMGGEPNYAVTVLPYVKSSNKNTIYLTLWLADLDVQTPLEFDKAPTESFSTVIYYLENNYLTIKIPVGLDPKKRILTDKIKVINRVQEALKYIEFGNFEEIKVGGDFNVWNFEYEESSFLDMILINPIMNVYLYVEENMTPFALKKRLDIHYRSMFTDEAEGETPTDKPYISNKAAVSITLTQSYVGEDSDVEVYDVASKTTTKAKFNASTPYVHINITQAESQEILDEFIMIFQLLIKHYNNNKEEIIAAYYEIAPELVEVNKLLTTKQKYTPKGEIILGKITTGTKENSRIRHLKEIAPEVFVTNYARRCQAELQPIIITDDEIPKWQSRKIEGKARQVLKYPHANPKWNFVCPDDDIPYPTVKVNRDLSNKDIYPYIPCCAKTDKMSHGIKSKYRDYIEGVPVTVKKGAKADKPISTHKILEPHKLGKVPGAISTILSRYSDKPGKIRRYGAIYGPNSLLHCISVAFDDPKYMNQTTDAEKEAYVVRMRKYISQSVHPALLKQELYNYKDQDILELLADNNKFYDPTLIYRAIEAVYNINIYVFSRLQKSDFDSYGGILEIPRFQMFHSRPTRLNLPTVIILKSGGSEADNLEYPHCELIVDYNKETSEITKAFGETMTTICQNSLQATMRTITWTSILSQNDTPDKFSVNSDLYYYIDYLNILPPAVSQFIDNNGKLRALTINLGNANYVTIATIPSQPGNLPVSNDISRIPIEMARKIFGMPTGVTYDISGDVQGLWYQIMDLTYGNHVYVTPSKMSINNLNEGPKDPLLPATTIVSTQNENLLATTEDSVTLRLVRLRRVLNIITQIVKWLYERARLNRQMDPNIFASEYIVANTTPVVDSSDFYNISQIPRRFPIATTLEDAINIFEKIAPNSRLFEDGKIIMYSEAFANRMLRMLRDYHDLHVGLNSQPEEFIQNYYETEYDFLPIPNSAVFLSEKDLTAWLASVKSTQTYTRYFNIRIKIDLSLAFNTDPILYQNDDAKIYLIQNVIGGNKSKALTVAKNWLDHKVNMGSDPLPLGYVPAHLVYGISPSSTLQPIEDHTNGEEIFLKVLYYGNQSEKFSGKENPYAAMLDLL